MASFFSKKQRGKGWGPRKSHAEAMILNGISEVPTLTDYRRINFTCGDRIFALSLTNAEAKAIMAGLQRSFDRKPE